MTDLQFKILRLMARDKQRQTVICASYMGGSFIWARLVPDHGVGRITEHTLDALERHGLLRALRGKVRAGWQGTIARKRILGISQAGLEAYMREANTPPEPSRKFYGPVEKQFLGLVM